MKPFLNRRALLIALLVAVAVTALIGAQLGRSLRFGMPDVAALEDYAPMVTTRVFAADGSVLRSFAEQRRVMIPYGEIPENFRHALLATEDNRFFQHPGLDPIGIARVLWTNLYRRNGLHGASTLTQQLARSLFLTMEKTFRRKSQEALLTLELERLYTKEEIFGFYCNQIYMGHGRYGIEAASRFYYHKSASEMDMAEAAMLAGLIQRPESISPFKNPERAQRRRNHVLNRMVQVGYLSPADAERARTSPLPVPEEIGAGLSAPYFIEDVRRWLKSKWGDESLYRSGLSVHTTLDPRAQQIANTAVEAGLRDLDKRQGWRGPRNHIDLDEEGALESFVSESWAGKLEPGRIVESVVVAVDRSSARVRVDHHEAVLPEDGYKWTSNPRADRLFSVGDIIDVRLATLSETESWTVTLEQEPEVEAALIAIDPSNGEILALVGGFDFKRSEFNRATQARRQTGSSFKPFVFASALAQNWTLADTLVDEATVFLDRRNPDPYIPKNYTDKYYGTLTLRRALERSANVATVKLLNRVGARETIRMARDLGIRGNLQPYPSLALGAFESTLKELTGAYAAFANQGVRVEPHLVRRVEKVDGTRLYDAEPEIREAVSPRVADTMNRLLHGVITDGTGRAASGISHPLAGKTGTTDENTDAWFIGYSPNIAVGVWVGFDEKKSIGKRETGAGAALPIWKGFMESWLKGLPETPFPTSPRIGTALIDRTTGLRANPSAGCSPVFREAFAEGTEPTRFCSIAQHRKLLFPATIQHYPLTEDGRIEIPDEDLIRMLKEIPTLSLSNNGRDLLYRTGDNVLRLPLRLTPGSSVPEIPDSVLEFLIEEEKGPSTWLGVHGEPARLEFIED
jgi:penicillin-binding protein 1A